MRVAVLASHEGTTLQAIIDAFPGAVVAVISNTHPALLPKFGGQGMYGLHVHRAVLASGDPVTGASVHWVNGEYDAGPVIARREVPVQPGDTPETLAARVQVHERALLVEVLAGFMSP